MSTADTDIARIAEEVFDYVDAQGVMINRELHCGRIADILAREFAAKDAEIARLKDRHQQSPEYLSMLQSFLDMKQHAERVETERDQCLAGLQEVNRRYDELKQRNDSLERELAETTTALSVREDELDGLAGMLKEAQARAERAEAELAESRQYRTGHLPTCAGMDFETMRCGCGYLDGTAYRELVAELDQLRAEVEAIEEWKKRHGDPAKEIADLRAQLAAAQEAMDGIALACKRVREGADKDHVLYCIESKARAAIDAARSKGGAK